VRNGLCKYPLQGYLRDITGIFYSVNESELTLCSLTTKSKTYVGKFLFIQVKLRANVNLLQTYPLKQQPM